MAGLSPHFRALWMLVRFLGKVCFSLALLCALLWFFYFRHFRIRYFEEPHNGLNYVTDTDAPQRNDFRKRTLSAVTDTLRLQLAKIKRIRRQTKGGTVRPPTLERDATDIRNRLKEIMVEARLRRIPKQFQKNYEPALYALQDAFYSINDLEDSFDQETKAARKKLYNDSIKKWKSAEHNCRITHDYFASDEWRDF